MNIEQIETEFFALPRDSQVVLLTRLLEYVANAEIDSEIADVWVEEAEQRDQAIDGGQVLPKSAEEVFERILSSLR
ncbi:MAG: addiction module protein [Microcoleaceae cyanobacterium]